MDGIFWLAVKCFLSKSFAFWGIQVYVILGVNKMLLYVFVYFIPLLMYA